MRHAENLLILKALWPSRVACASCLFVLFERLPSAGFGTTGRRVYPHERFQSTPFSNLLILKALWPSRVACASCLFVLFERLPSAGFGTTGRRVYPHERFQSTPFSGWPMCEQYRP